MRELNQAIQDKTGADADDIAASQAVLARHKLTGEQISQLTPLLVDYARRTGTDLPSAGDKLGKAIAGNARAMKELGIPFKNTGDAAGNFEQILTGLQDKVGGFAESEAQTLDGKLVMLETKFGDVQETVGEALLPVLVQLADITMQVVDFVQENVDWLGPLAIGLATVTVAVLALNAAMSANPISLVVLAIAALVAGLVWAYNESEEFRAVVDAAFSAIAAAGTWLWNNALQPVIQFLVRGFALVVRGIASMLDVLGNIPGFEWARDAATKMKGAADKADEVADSIRKIPDRKDVEVNVRKTGIDGIQVKATTGGWAMKAYDQGGRPKVGELALFHADELWVPDTAGTVLTKAQTSRLIGDGPSPLVGAPSAVAVAPAPTLVQLSFMDDALGTARKLYDLLRKVNESNGGRGLTFA